MSNETLGGTVPESGMPQTAQAPEGSGLDSGIFICPDCGGRLVCMFVNQERCENCGQWYEHAALGAKP